MWSPVLTTVSSLIGPRGVLVIGRATHDYLSVCLFVLPINADTEKNWVVFFVNRADEKLHNAYSIIF